MQNQTGAVRIIKYIIVDSTGLALIPGVNDRQKNSDKLLNCNISSISCKLQLKIKAYIEYINFHKHTGI